MIAPGSVEGRCARAAALAGLTVALGTAAHATACRMTPSPAVALAGLAVLAPLCWVLTSGHVGAARIVGTVLGGQLALHLAFVLSQPMTVGAAGTAMSMHGTGAARSTPSMPSMPSAGPVAAHLNLLPGGVLMAVLHLLAALALAGWLTWGERRLWRALVQVVAPLLTGWVGPAADSVRPAVTPSALLHRPRPARTPTGPLLRRGPPALHA